MNLIWKFWDQSWQLKIIFKDLKFNISMEDREVHAILVTKKIFCVLMIAS